MNVSPEQDIIGDVEHAHYLTCCIETAKCHSCCLCVGHLIMLVDFSVVCVMIIILDVYLASYCEKHLSTYLHPVAITVETSKTDFCTCSSSQFS